MSGRAQHSEPPQRRRDQVPHRIGALVDALGHRQPDPWILRDITARAPDLLPGLIAVVAEPCLIVGEEEDDDWPESDPAWAAVHAARILRQLGDPRAVLVFVE